MRYDAVSPQHNRRGSNPPRPSVVTFKEPSYIEYGGGNGYDLERTSSLKGITVHRGRVPAGADVAADRHYESYL